LKKLGANVVISTSNKGWVDELKKAAFDLNALSAFECVGKDMTSTILKAMPEKSTVYTYGNLEMKDIEGLPTSEFIFKEKTLTGFWLNTWMKEMKPDDLSKWTEFLISDLESGSDMFETPTRVELFTLPDVDKAMGIYTKDMSAGKVIIRPNY